MTERRSFFDTILQRGMMRRLGKMLRDAPEADLRQLRRNRSDVSRLKTRIDEFLHIADGRLARPITGSQTFPHPYDADWAWRPGLWTGPLPVKGISSAQSKSALGREVTLFHDCPHSELTLRQLRNMRRADLAPYGLRLDVFKFTGSYLSLAIELPEEAARGLKRRHLIRLDMNVEMEKPLEVFARLNIQHGPNTEQLVREMPLNADEVMIEFDLAYTKLNEKRVEKLWLDVIFEGPQMNQVSLYDMTFSRRPRAEL